MKSFQKIIAVFLTLSILICTTGTSVLAYENSNKNSNISTLSEKSSAQIYDSLDADAKIRFLNYIESMANNGDTSLLEYHIKYVDKNYKQQVFSKENSEKNMLAYAFTRSSDLSITAQIAALNLPIMVEYATVAMAAALAIPVGNVVDVITGLGAAVIYAMYWDEVEDLLDDLMWIFVDEFGTFVIDAFNYIKARAEGTPTQGEFNNFDDHYERHSDEFKDMPGGNGKKPSKKEYWAMALELMRRTGDNIKTGVQNGKPWATVIFDNKTLEYLVYNTRTKQIITYYLPKHDTYLKTGNMSKWIDAVNKYVSDKF